MKSPALLLAAFATLSATVLFVRGADAPPTEVVKIDHTQVDAAFAKGMPLLVNTQYKIQAGRRVMPGEAEVHASDTDIFFVTEGSATLVTGGTVVDPKTTAAGEVRAPKITNGTARALTKGDVIVIPAGTPHQFTAVSGTFVYFVVKVTK